MDEGSRQKLNAPTDDGVWGAFLGGMNVYSLVYLSPVKSSAKSTLIADVSCTSRWNRVSGGAG